MFLIALTPVDIVHDCAARVSNNRGWETRNGVRREGRACRDRRMAINGRVALVATAGGGMSSSAAASTSRTSRASRTARTSRASLPLAKHYRFPIPHYAPLPSASLETTLTIQDNFSHRGLTANKFSSSSSTSIFPLFALHTEAGIRMHRSRHWQDCHTHDKSYP